MHHLDKIVVLSGGTVAEVGTGPELLAARGVYSKLHAAGNYGGALPALRE